jgi:hypothetical protein
VSLPGAVSSSNLFLEDPSQLPELDSWIEAYLQTQRRFTFTEEEVLKPLWEEGEDVRLREDSRFQMVLLPQQSIVPQWRLSMHIVANQALYELLVDEHWDGQDLYSCLQKLDQEASETSLHIFCLHDDRFVLSEDEQGPYCLSLHAAKGREELTLEQKNVIERVAPQLLMVASQKSKKPWSTTTVMEELKRLSQLSEALDTCVPAALENWLLNEEAWVRVGVDIWLPKSEIPRVEKQHRYAVLPVFSAEDSSNIAIPKLVNEHALPYEAFQIEAIEEPTVAKGIQFPNKSIRWKVILRTFHINEGSIPVPKQARALYPHARKLFSIAALAGVWFTDASEMTVWLDKEQHQLYGSDLQEQLAFLEAGTVLEVTLTATSIVFRTLGIDQKVAEEEVRLVDLTDLAQLRSTTMESYRSSLREILARHNMPLRFQDLYEELCSRQQHQPNRATIRSILSSSPEFVFVKTEGKWGLNLTVSAETSVKSLRRAAMIAHHAESETSVTQEEPVSLSEMIVKNRQQLSALRSMFLGNDKPVHSSYPVD